MVNKKLMTSLFNVKFKLFKDGCTRFEDADGNILTNPLPQYRYITDRVVHPKRTVYDDYPDLIYAGTTHDDLLVYTYDWSTDGVTPWNFTNDIVEKDIELTTSNWVEKKWKIEFELVPTGNLVIDSACTKEALPPTIENISNGRTVTSTAANNYASDYTKNKFKYSTTGSDLHCVMRNATGNSCKWIDQYGQPFYFGTTRVYKDLRLHMDWAFKTWALTIDYNTGPNRYSNDLATDYVIKGKSYTNTENAIIPKYVEDNFTISTSPTQASSIASYLNGITSRFTGAGVTSDVKVVGWYNEMGRSSVFDGANFKFIAPKTIYAKWVNTENCSRYFYTSASYNSTTRLNDLWSTNSSNYTTPSFCPSMTAAVMGPGGNSNYFSGNEATGAEYFEVTICNPGGSATESTKAWDGDASKTNFEYLALGSSTSYSKSYIKRGNWKVESSRGAAGGTREYERYNIGDDGDEEKITDGDRSVRGYFIANSGKGKTIYTQVKNDWSSRSNTGTTTQFRFRGVCNSPKKWYSTAAGNSVFGHGNSSAVGQTITIYFEAWFYYNNTSWYSGLLHVGTDTYKEVGSDNSNRPIYGWSFSYGWTGYAWWWTCGNWGNGGQCLFFSTIPSSIPAGQERWSTKSYPNQCYGHGGYAGFYFPKQ